MKVIRKERETSELTYDTVIKELEELEGLEGKELYEAVKKYEFVRIRHDDYWCSLVALSDLFFNIRKTFKRGLIKLRRTK